MSARDIADSLQSLEPGSHLCCIYDREEEHRAVLTPFLLQGLERQEKVLCVVDTHDVGTILGYLRDAGTDPDTALASGQLVMLTRSDVYFRNGGLDPETMIEFLSEETERALAEGWSAMRGTAETSWALHGDPGSERLIEYEAKLNDFLPGSKCLALCQYDRRQFDPDILIDVLHTHPVVYFGEDEVNNPFYIPPEVFLPDRATSRFQQWTSALLEHQRDREALARSEQQFLDFAETAEQVFWIRELDPERVVYVNPAFERVWHRAVSDLKEGTRVWMEAIHPDDRPSVEQAFTRWVHDELGSSYEVTYRILTAQGQVKWISDHGRVLARDGGRVSRVGGIAEDITEQIQSEKRLRRLNRELAAIRNCNQALLRAADEKSLLESVCRIACEEAGYRMAWIGYAEHDEAKSVRPVAWAGVEDGYLTQANVTWADTKRGRGPEGTAIRTGKTFSVQDFSTDPRTAPWRDAALQRGYRSSLVVPLADGKGEVFGHLAIYSSDVNAFPPGEIQLLEELGNDLAFGIVLLRTRKELRKAEEERISLLEGLDRVSFAIQEASDLEQMTSDALDAVLSIFGCDRAFLMYPCDPDAPTWRIPKERTQPEYPGVLATGFEMPMDPDVAQTLRLLLAAAGPVAFGPGSPNPLPPVMSEHFGSKCFLSMALRPKTGLPWQFGIHQCTHARVWTAQEQLLLAQVGHRLADGLTAMLAHRELAESEQRYRQVFEDSPVALIAADFSDIRELLGRLTARGIANLSAYLTEHPETVRECVGLVRLVDVNQATLELYEASSKEDLLTGFQRTFAPDTYATFREELLALWRGDLSAAWDTVVETLSGETRSVTVEYTVCPGFEDTLAKVIVSFVDMTERKLLADEQARLAAAVEQADEAIAITDPAANIVYANPAFERVSGYTRAELLGANPRVLQSGRHDDAFYEEMWSTLLAGRTWHGTLVNKTKAGELFAEAATITPIRDGDGTLVNYVGVKRDLTRELALEEQLRQSQKLEVIGKLAGGIAHDFNNLLQAMLSHTRLLRGAPANVESELSKLEAQIQRGAALARQLLLFSRHETAKREALDLNDVVREASEVFRRLVRENVELEIDTAEDPIMVEADRGQLHQVLMNLAINAIDAMPLGGCLAISTETGDETAQLTVRDTGQGIPEELSDTIFEPFFTTKGPGIGTGLGLSVVHGIVAQHGGRIELESVENVGTTFRVVLPRLLSCKPLATSTAIPDEACPTGSGKRVLLVEDEAAVRDSLSEILRSLGYTVAAVGTRSETEKLPVEQPFDLLLSDLMLPDTSGDALALELRERWPAMRVILMSGYYDADISRSLDGLGPAEFLPKPFDMRALEQALARVLGAR